MTKSTITREQLIKKAQEQIEFCRHTKITGEGRAHVNQCAALFEIALAAMNGEPVTWGNGCDKTVPAALRYLAENERPFGGESRFNAAHLYQLAREIELMAEAPLYRHAQPAPERDQVRIAHAEWSQATFGNVGPVGPLKHLSKEALEAAAEPGDLSEWADMQFLLWDAQRRAGITDEQITQAMIEKLAVNKQRSWPEPKDGEPRLHIKEQPAPVVPEEWTIADAVKFCKETGRQDAGAAMDAWNACRAAMLQTKSLTSINPAPDLVSLQKKAESIIGNYPGIPDGYVMVPKDPSQAHLNSIAMRYRHDFYLLNDAQKDSALATARQMYEECSGQGFYTLPAGPKEEK